ncbi:hypothetical protein [Legionella saoudiensis]|uniref:hypothetical protein n=1 Tax=Legionella saoudiensis TaxID=1750561 RepID=UPI00073003D5|nr:hypothetical protein [Legionella saoudiensis]
MSNDKLYGLYGKGAKDPEEQVTVLRSKLKALIEENNNITKQIWDIDFQLNNAELSETQRAELMALSEELNKQISKGDYAHRIDEFKQQIIDLEMELYGHSDLDSNSPYSI